MNEVQYAEAFVLPQIVRNPIGHPANGRAGGSNAAVVGFVRDNRIFRDRDIHEAQNAKMGELGEA